MSTRTTCAVQLVWPVLLVALALGCERGRSDAANVEGVAQKPAATTTTPEPPAQATVSLSGCVEVAPGQHQYVLRNVRFEPRQSADPHRDTTTAGAHGITEGAWVRLEGGDQDLTSHAGRRITITGTVTDNGQNTVGTAGTPGAPTPSGDTSQAASTKHHSDKVKSEAGRIARESIADGTAAQVRVKKVDASGEKCPLELRPQPAK